MLKDITIGQYFPGTSPMHKMDPRMKISLTFLYIIALFLAKNIAAVGFGAVFVIVCYWISKIPLNMIIKSLKPIVPIIIFTSVLNVFFVESGELLFEWKFIHIYRDGIIVSILMSMRIICLIAGTGLLTYTTSPISLTDGIERLLGPLKKIKVPVHEIAMMMTIALRFIPTLIEETEKIMSAQKARGADLESGGIVDRAKALIPILIPLFISSFRRADELALAMECRCYRGGEGRTRMKVLKYTFVDFVALGLVVVFTAGIMGLNFALPTVM